MIDFAVQFCCHTQWNIRAEEQSVGVTDQSCRCFNQRQYHWLSRKGQVIYRRPKIWNIGIPWIFQGNSKFDHLRSFTARGSRPMVIFDHAWTDTLTRGRNVRATRTHVHKDTHGRVSGLSALCSELYTRYPPVLRRRRQRETRIVSVHWGRYSVGTPRVIVTRKLRPCGSRAANRRVSKR